MDSLVHRAAHGADPVMGALARCIETRRPPKLLKEVQVLEDAKGQTYHRGLFFFSRAKQCLRALAENYGIPLGQFLLCSTKPLKLEKRGAFLAADQARALESEEKDELIKVFVGNSPEPQSLVEIPHSLIHVCSDYLWQAFRLYVIYEGADRDDVLGRLRAEVSDRDVSG